MNNQVENFGLELIKEEEKLKCFRIFNKNTGKTFSYEIFNKKNLDDNCLKAIVSYLIQAGGN